MVLEVWKIIAQTPKTAIQHHFRLKATIIQATVVQATTAHLAAITADTVVLHLLCSKTFTQGNKDRVLMGILVVTITGDCWDRLFVEVIELNV